MPATHPLHSIKAYTDSALKQILPVSEGGIYRRMSRQLTTPGDRVQIESTDASPQITHRP
ncbi:MAG: hypothetical protein ACYCRH_03330 [Acidiferrobacteraceae bacterium]